MTHTGMTGVIMGGIMELINSRFNAPLNQNPFDNP